MADESPLDMNYLLKELEEAGDLPPALGGKRIDVLRREAWARMVEKGFVKEATETFAGEAASATQKVYRTESGKYEFWLEKKIGRGDVDVVVWEIDRKDGKIVSVEGHGMDAHPRGPGDPEVTSSQTKHFEKKTEHMQKWETKLKNKMGPDVKVKTGFEKDHQFFWRRRIEELKGLKDKTKALGYLDKASPLVKAVRVAKGVFAIADIAAKGLDVIDLEMMLYKNEQIQKWMTAMREGMYGAVKGEMDRAVTDYDDMGLGELFLKFYELFGLLGYSTAGAAWQGFLKALYELWEREAKTQKESKPSELEDDENSMLPDSSGDSESTKEALAAIREAEALVAAAESETKLGETLINVAPEADPDKKKKLGGGGIAGAVGDIFG